MANDTIWELGPYGAEVKGSTAGDIYIPDGDAGAWIRLESGSGYGTQQCEVYVPLSVLEHVVELIRKGCTKSK
jgi:hypothetical protein